MNRSPILVFCDFDGTVAKRDVGYSLFHHFSGGRNDDLIPDWKAGRISSREILLKEAAMVNATEQEIYDFLDHFDIDSGFAEFEALCRANDTEPIIVSEGLDFYIRHVLNRHNLGHLKVICNHGYLEENSIKIEFPYQNRSCRRCGSCKGERIAEYRAKVPPGCKVVFAGDGYSDACAAREADVLFAKKDLQEYCIRENIRYNTYVDFSEVGIRMIELGLLGRP